MGEGSEAGNDHLASGRFSRRSLLKGGAALGASLWVAQGAEKLAGAGKASASPTGQPAKEAESAAEPSDDNNWQFLVCPTSHMDWDWKNTFAEYVALGPIDDGDFAGAANTVLSGVCQLINGSSTFCFSLAEIAYLQAYLKGNPDSLPTLVNAGLARFALLGGGITSPDNLVCHGEVFIRNYLLGRRWATSVGLGANLAPVAWLPDDFGHDPQLPVVLEAMGLQWVGLSRVPGSQQPFANQPLDGSLSVADQLRSQGLVFPWTASDGSQVVAHFMPTTYGAMFYGDFDIDNLTTLFVEKDWDWPMVEGESKLFATAGGDFAISQWNGPDTGQGSWLTVVDNYNAAKAGTDPMATVGTFPQFMAVAASAPGTARSPLLAQNYWTGIFATRPRVKTLHNRAAQLALGAEAAATLLRLTSTYSTTTLDDLDAAIDRAWEALVPSSHHDFLPGTSPDRVYWVEQLPMLELAARLGEECLTRAVSLIAAGVTVDSTTGSGSTVVVFNPLGFARGGVVELSAGTLADSVAKVDFGSSEGPLQRLPDGGLLFQLPDDAEVDSFGYTTVTLQPGTLLPSPVIPELLDRVTLDNGVVKATIDRSRWWAITSFTIEGTELFEPNGHGNALYIYTDAGNLYQFGNEPLGGVGLFGKFADSGTELVGQRGEWVERGPVRWHFRATVTGDYNGSNRSQPVSYTLDYLLCAGEPVLRMRLTGAAPSGTSLVTSFDLAPAGDLTYGLTYGTANHYDDHLPTPYWTGPTFRATHDFVQTSGAPGPGLAIYHQGVPAWSIDSRQLLGALLRNTPGQDRGAAGTDPGVHALEYALGAADSSPVDTGDALRTALALTSPLVAAIVGANRPTAVSPNSPTEISVSLPPQGSLAGITSAGNTSPPAGILRAARTQMAQPAVDASGDYAERFSFILRVYLPDPASVTNGVTITLPSIPNLAGYDPDLTAVVVSALEEPVPTAPSVTVAPSGSSGTTASYTVSFSPQRALTTVQLTATRWSAQPTDGKLGLETGPPPHLN